MVGGTSFGPSTVSSAGILGSKRNAEGGRNSRLAPAEEEEQRRWKSKEEKIEVIVVQQHREALPFWPSRAGKESNVRKGIKSKVLKRL